MLNLLSKDFKLLFRREGTRTKKIITALMETVMIAFIVAVETVLFSMILKKINHYNQAPKAFLTVFLACVSIIMIVLGITRASKLFFNDKDTSQLINHPIGNDQIILSKLLILFIMHYASSLLLVYPLFVSYGLMMGKTVWFYYIVLFYPFFSFFFEVGISLFLVYPYKLVRDYLKKHLVLEFISSVLMMVILVFIYSKILNVFMQLVTNNNLNIIFSTKNIEGILRLRQHLVPVNFLTDIFIYGFSNGFWSLICISLGIFILGTTISVLSYSKLRSIKFDEKKHKNKKVKVRNIEKALLRKEFLLLFKDSNYLFSFTGLLITQPILMYLVVGALNKIFNTGQFLYYTSMLPAFVPLLDVYIIILFTVIISSGANQYITMEEKTIKIIKTIPVSYRKQLAIKVFIPLLFSFISLAASLSVLVILEVITVTTFIFSFVLSFMILLIFDAVSLMEELNIRRNKPRHRLRSGLVSYLLPTLYFFIAVIVSSLSLSIYWLYGIGIVMFGGCGVLLLIYLKKKMALKFMELEVVN